MKTTAKNETKITAEAGKQELFIVREFDAPCALVFKAHTDAALLQQWVGPKGLTMKIDHFDPRSGGAYRYIQSDGQGNEYAFHGVIHEVVVNERIIQTFEFEGLPEKGHVVMETTRFETLSANRTRITTQSVFQSVADRDGMVHSGMERGVVDSHNQLDEVLEKIK